MTREEAKTVLVNLTHLFGDEEVLGALEVAISALSAETATVTEPSDLISRAEAIKAVCNAICESDVPYYPQCDQVKCCDDIQALLNVPSVSAERVVRCKDCKYLGVKDFAYGYCKKRVTGIVMPNDFCSWAMKKGGNDD